MKLFPTVLAVAALTLAVPRSASAQCADACVRFVKETGETGGYGCVEDEGSGMSCVATTSRCNLQRCVYALLTTPEGHIAGVRDGCEEPAAEGARAETTAAEKRGRLLKSAPRHGIAAGPGPKKGRASA